MRCRIAESVLLLCTIYQYKEYLVILATKWDLMLRSFTSETVSIASFERSAFTLVIIYVILYDKVLFVVKILEFYNYKI